MFDLRNLSIVLSIKSLPVYMVIDLDESLDNLDYISTKYYGSTDYWSYLAYFNDVINPFQLVDQGFTTLKLFSKTDIDKVSGVLV